MLTFFKVTILEILQRSFAVLPCNGDDDVKFVVTPETIGDL